MNTDMDIDINTVTDTITCRLVEARADLGITQKELASATGISLKTIANIESKQHIPSLLYAMRIADFFLKPVTSLSSNSMDTTAGRFPVITISTTGCCFRKTQRHRTRNGAMPLCLFCNIQFYFCCLGKFFFSVQQFIFLLFRQAVENFLVTKKETVNTLSCTNRHQQSFCYLSSFFDFSIFTFFFSCGICFASFIFSLTDGFSSFFSTDTLPTVQSCPP